MNNTPFAVFVVAHAYDDDSIFIAATTRDDGRVGLPGGKLDSGETPVEAAVRESAEEGWDVAIPANALPYHTAMVDGKLVWWFLANGRPVKRSSWKEQARGIKPVWVSDSVAAATGFGNQFLADIDFCLDDIFCQRGLADNFSDFAVAGCL